MSESAQQLPSRSEVPVNLTWDLSTIFASNSDWEAAFARVKSDLPRLASYKGRVRRSGRILLEYLNASAATDELLGKLHYFAAMQSDQDTTISANKAMKDRVQTLSTEYGAAVAWYLPEVLSIKPERLEQFIKRTPGLEAHRHDFDDINRSRPHILSHEVEAVLAAVSKVRSAPDTIYTALTYADLKLPMVKDDAGNNVQLTEDNYGPLLDSKNREVRKAAFEAMFGSYDGLRNSISAMYAAQVESNMFAARTRKHESSLAKSLHGSNIPVSVYDSLVDTVHANLPLLQRYLELRKRLLGVDELHMYDLYVPLVPDVEDKIGFAEAQETVLAALAPLGEEYCSALRKGYESRWIDVMPNEGKAPGAYSWGGYGTNPFILLNWQGNMEWMFTLAHEEGHSMHSFLSRRTQPFQYSSYTMFCAEIASTTNEALLAHYLLSKTTDPKIRLHIINSQLEAIRTTLVRQTLFAEFEREAHALAESGESLTADALCAIHKKLNEKYYGSTVHIDDLIGIEWARIPHFFSSFYVFQYATGISSAISLAHQITTEGEPAVARYLNFLKSGCSGYSIDMLKSAGVDLSTPAPIQAAFDTFAYYLDLFEKEYARLE